MMPSQSDQSRREAGWTDREVAAFEGRLNDANGLPDVAMSSRLKAPPYSDPLHREQLPLLDTDKHLIVLSLGPADTRSFRKAVEISSPEKYCYDTEGRTEISNWHMRVSASCSPSAGRTIRLPLSHSLVNDPLLFHADDLNNVQFQFGLYRGNDVSKRAFGQGVALLDTLRTGNSPGRESLLRDCTGE